MTLLENCAPVNVDVVADNLLDVSPEVRYAAIYWEENLTTVRKKALNSSSDESDKYEEIIVNPTLITLLRQRGNIDCGGLRYVCIYYGSFTQFVMPLKKGHVSLCFEPDCDIQKIISNVLLLLGSNSLCEKPGPQK